MRDLLKNINTTIVILIFIANIVALGISDSNKTTFILVCLFFNICFFFLHWFLIVRETKQNLTEIKREAFYINYPLGIGIFFLCLIIIMACCTGCLFLVNREAMNLALIFTFCVSMITMMMPSIILIAYVYFLFPAFILPSISTNKKQKRKSYLLLLTLVTIFFAISAIKIVTYSLKTVNISKQNRYKVIKLPVQYSTQYLQLKELSQYGKKKLSQVKLILPFVYTADTFNYSDVTEAEIFCNSMGARVPNYLEMYNIIFNKFNTFGEKYYWTSNTDGRIPLLIHFKNMSYTVEPYTGEEKPVLYCVANGNDNKRITQINYLYRDYSKDKRLHVKSFLHKQYGIRKSVGTILDTQGLDRSQTYQKQAGLYTQEAIETRAINSEKKHVNFSVKEVSEEILTDLIRKGYDYNAQLKINPRYETNDAVFSTQIVRDVNKKQIRLCYYPFTDYGNMNIYQESEIWKQSFCSPAFELISPIPVIKTQNEKDGYCRSFGGRVPNIPELNGILKTLRINNIGTKYWTDNKITQNNSTIQLPVIAYYNDSRFMKIQEVYGNENISAYTFCIKPSPTPSKIIANYKSRFKGLDGKPYAQAQCPNCQYYEVPDTILLSY